MRTPTSQNEAYRAWKKRLAGEQLPIHLNDPQPGYYKTRAWSRGPYIPAKIWIEQDIDEHGELVTDEIYRAEIGEQEWDAHEAWLRIAQRPVTLMEWETLSKALPLINWNGTQAQIYQPDWSEHNMMQDVSKKLKQKTA